MKVYIVLYCFYDDFNIEKVFDTEGKAAKYVESQRLRLSDDMKKCYSYEAFELE
jgi:hypothetical protein